MSNNSNDQPASFDPANFEEEDAASKFTRKSKEAPFVPIGIGLGLAGLAYGAYNFRNRGEMSPSIYLIHLRVGVQGAVITALTLGVCYTMYQTYLSKSVSDFVHHKKKEE